MVELKMPKDDFGGVVDESEDYVTIKITGSTGENISKTLTYGSMMVAGQKLSDLAGSLEGSD